MRKSTQKRTGCSFSYSANWQIAEPGQPSLTTSGNLRPICARRRWDCGIIGRATQTIDTGLAIKPKVISPTFTSPIATLACFPAAFTPPAFKICHVLLLFHPNSLYSDNGRLHRSRSRDIILLGQRLIQVNDAREARGQPGKRYIWHTHFRIPLDIISYLFMNTPLPPQGKRRAWFHLTSVKQPPT